MKIFVKTAIEGEAETENMTSMQTPSEPHHVTNAVNAAFSQALNLATMNNKRIVKLELTVEY